MHDAGTGKFCLIFRPVHPLCRQGTDSFPKRHAGFFHRFSGNIRRTRCIGTGVIRGRIGICADNGNVIHITLQTLCRHLGQNRIAAGSHIGRCDQHRIAAVVVDFDRCRSDIEIGNTGALHRHRNADAAHLSISHITARIFLIPADHLFRTLHALVKRTAVCRFAIVSRHELSLTDHVLLPDPDRIDAKTRCHLTDSRFYGKDTLRRTVSAVSTG